MYYLQQIEMKVYYYVYLLPEHVLHFRLLDP